jgi:uncharacterized protein
MSASIPSPTARRPRINLHRWVRQLHLWIGAWGALAAVLYGSTGLIMSHRFGDGAWPQGDSEELGKRELAVPAHARRSAEALSLWLSESEGLDAQIIRKPPPGEPAKGPERWTLSGGTASEGWALEYKVGSDTAELKRSRHSTLAALTRMHKAVSGGPGWRILGDSFAIGMILLGVSGLLLWARGRTLRQMVVSVAGVSATVMIVVLVANLF